MYHLSHLNFYRNALLYSCLLLSAAFLSACGGGGSSSGGGSSLPPSNVLYVDASAVGDATGDTWANAFTDLQAALAATNVSKNEIWVAAGTYKPTSTADRSISFTLLSGVSVYGGFAGNETARSARNVNANVTILSGNINTQGIATDNSYHVVRGASNSTLDGFTIRDGYASEFTPPDNQGGGIYNTAASLVIRNCTLTVNQAEYGGGIYCGSGADALITNCVFDANSAPGGFGGGVCVEDSTTTIVACIFRNNAAPGAAGGALANISANTVVKNCLFHDNTATGGGAVSNEASSPSFTNCTFSDNNASSFGGAFYNFSNSDPVLVNCIVWQNKIAGVAAADMDEEFRNSDVNSSVTATYTMTAYAFAGTGNLTANPLFTTAGSVFTLQDGSFAIDVGTNAGVTSTDLVGNMRVVNGPDSGDAVTTAVVDMGCYENQVVGAILAPPIVNN